MAEETPQAISTFNDSSGASSRSPKKFKLLTLVFAATTLICACGWYQSYAQYGEADWQKNFTASWGTGATLFVERWKAGGNKSSVWFDANSDRNFERVTFYTFGEKLIRESFDDNEDGYFEWSVSYIPSGEKAAESYDLDADGCAERSVYFNGKLKVEYKDTDFDCRYDSVLAYSDGYLVNSFAVQDVEDFLSQPKVEDFRAPAHE
jgi:hypothetical protein